MAKETKRQKLVKALEWLGFEKIESSSRKYLCFQMGGQGNKYYIGKSGGLRYGKNVTSSRSLTHKVDSIIAKHQKAVEVDNG